MFYAKSTNIRVTVSSEEIRAWLIAETDLEDYNIILYLDECSNSKCDTFNIVSAGTTDDVENTASSTSACFYIKNYSAKRFSYNGRNNCYITYAKCNNTNRSDFNCGQYLTWENTYWKGNIWGARCEATVQCPK